MKICIDAGHGPNTPGKRTPKFPDGHFMHEYEFNAATARHVVDQLKSYADVEILTTFEDGRDVPLKERTDRANAWGADVFVSIHANAFGPGGWNDARGVETYAYITKPGEAVKLAGIVQQHLVRSTGWVNRGVKFADFHVLRETRMTAILCECGFMTNEAEAALLQSDVCRQTCAKAIAEGIAECYGLERTVDLNVPVLPEVKAMAIATIRGRKFDAILTPGKMWVELREVCEFYGDRVVWDETKQEAIVEEVKSE